MFRPVTEAEFRVEGGRRILQVHSRGARRFSPFCCYVTAYGKSDSIEQHYQTSKLFEGNRRPRTWREGKDFSKRPPRGLGLKQIGWVIGAHTLPCRPNAAGTSFAVNDFGVQNYLRMWHRHLTGHPELVAEARQYDGYEDPFEGDFPFGQRLVFELVTREGVEALAPMFAELVEVLSHPERIPHLLPPDAPREPPSAGADALTLADVLGG